MIVLTGAAGFIGSCLLQNLNSKGHCDILLVDDFSRQDKLRNLAGKDYAQMLPRDLLFDWMEENHRNISFVVHLGARTDTGEPNTSVFDRLNLNYSKKVWETCRAHQLPLLYASSAATYGKGEHGYSDDHEMIERLQPLNPYGQSKHDFDRWVLAQKNTPPFWAGLKFFNVYGPNEYHKGAMASAMFHFHNQVREDGHIRLFRSHHPKVADGEQKRDFIYVMDVVDVCWFMMREQPASGIYNLGTAKASSYLEVADAIFRAMGKPPSVRFIDTPERIRYNYQYFTEATTDKLARAGYPAAFRSLGNGVGEYIEEYLSAKRYY